MGIFIVGILVILVFSIFWITQPLLFVSRGTEIGPVDPARLNFHVRMLSETLVPRDAGHPQNLDRVAVYIRKEFEKAEGIVAEQPYQVDGKTYRNVIASYGPDTKKRVVIGAHYDACGEFPGADDNASAVAGLIELAYLLNKQPLSTRVELVAYTLEEPPHYRTENMGSAIHAKSLRQQGAYVRLMISLEMIGYFSDKPGSQEYPLGILKVFYPHEGNFIAVVGRLGDGLLVRRVKKAMHQASPLSVCSINAPQIVPGIDFSDHLNYWNAGYNAVMISDTAFYRNFNYHRDGDTADRLDYKRMAMVVQGTYAVVLDWCK
jgi:Zn-dependent M28 family amino/carboxypeptidase